MKKRIKFGKCSYWKKCKLYDEENKICNEEGGFYGSKYSGCVKKFWEVKK